MMNNRKYIIRFIAMFLVVALSAPVNINAATIDPVVPYASNYLDSYSSYVYSAGSGNVRVYFSVTGDDYMDDIGAMSIILYESTNNSTWNPVKTFSSTTTSSMLGHGVMKYVSYVSYQGVAGRYYKAYVKIWAEKDGSGDARYLWTSSKKAT